MNTFLRLSALAFALLFAAPVEELHAILGKWLGKDGYVTGTAIRVARRSARRTTDRVVSLVAEDPTTTADVSGIAIGTAVAALPPDCVSQVIDGLTYFDCGGIYYQPQYAESILVYVVVVPPQ